MICNPSLPSNSVVPNQPNYIQAAHADVVEAWVKDGGVLLMFANDKTNSLIVTELEENLDILEQGPLPESLLHVLERVWDDIKDLDQGPRFFF